MDQNNPTSPVYDIGTKTNSSSETKKPMGSESIPLESDNESKVTYQKYISGKPTRIIIRARISHDNDQ